MSMWKQWRQWICMVALLCAGISLANAAEPSSEPILRIEAGMHTAMINRVSVDSAGRYAVTASDDKTARVWDLSSGALLRVLRPPIGDGNLGKIYCVAITPDGETVAVGGWTRATTGAEQSIYLFDRATGRLKQRLVGDNNVTLHLAFSTDGRWLAATLGATSGIRVWDWRSNAPPLADQDYKAQSQAASWSSDNRLAIASYDGRLRLYRVQPGKLAKVADVKAPGGERPYGVAFSPDGRELAVGYADSTRVDILDGEGLAVKFTPSSNGVTNGDLSTVAWSSDGRTLYSGGRWDVNSRYMIRRWPAAGRGAPVDVPTVDEAIMDLVALPQGQGGAGGGVLVGGSDPAWGVLDAAGRWQPRREAPVAKFIGTLTGFKLSADGREVQFGFARNGKVPHRFQVASRQLQAGTADHLTPPRIEGLAVSDWENMESPTLAGQPIKLDIYEKSRSLAIAPGNGSFALGSDWSLRYFNAAGKELWSRQVPGVVWSVNIPASGKLVVAACDDGTIRWHRLSDGQELLAFFPHADQKRWVLWTPSGYYDASPGGEELIGWSINRGADAAADFFPASRFRDRFRRPDIIDRVLDTLDEDQAIAAADAARGTRAQAINVAQVLPPVVELVSPPEVSTNQTQLTLRYRTRSAANAPVTGVRVRVNGEAQPTARNLAVQAAADVYEVMLTVPPQDSQVQVFAENRHGTSAPGTVRVKWTGTAAAFAVPPVGGDQGFVIRPKLYVLAIGVGQKYQRAAKLTYPAKDATDFVEAMRRQEGVLYRQVQAKLLIEDDATRDNIVDALDWLQRQVTQHDVGMLFLSGHGDTDNDNNYFFVPVNADPARRKSTTVSMADINSTYAKRAGRWIVFIDTCRSGGVLGTGRRNDVNGAVAELLKASGAMIFSSSTTGQFSLERREWGNGAFTKALLEGLDGEAAQVRVKGSRITHNMLSVYVSERVKALTNNDQTPVTQNPDGLPDFPLAMVVK